jgi:hypothetical protein
MDQSVDQMREYRGSFEWSARSSSDLIMPVDRERRPEAMHKLMDDWEKSIPTTSPPDTPAQSPPAYPPPTTPCSAKVSVIGISRLSAPV